MAAKSIYDIDFGDLDEVLSGSIDKVNPEVLKDKIIKVVESILSSKFASDQKKRIIQLDRRLNFACPYCGDSRYNNRKKRGNLYLDNLHYKCYNTGCQTDSRTLEGLINDFHMEEEFTASETLYIRSKRGSEIRLGGSGTSTFTTHLLNLDEYAIDRTYLMSLLGLKELADSRRGREYMIARKQYGFDHRLFAMNDRTEDLYFFNLNKKGTGVIGLQMRHLNARKNDRRFTTENFSKLIIDHMLIEDPDPDIMAMMDKYGLLYNILRIDLSKPVQILEGPIDANHITNAMATMSASTRVYMNNGIYLYDNSIVDDAGKSSAIERLKENCTVFAWKKFTNRYPQFTNCKDINDIVRKDDQFPINDVVMKYYINDILDIIYI